MVAGFGSLFMVAGKRYSELHTLGSEAGTRRSLVRYTDTYLRFVWSIAATSTALAYCLWAFEQVNGSVPWQSLSIVPFVLGLLRYAVDIDAGKAAEPEDIILGDRGLQAIGVVWLVLVCLGVLGG
jgi:decaprenyl-phosphate phosphoribosyltransferase